MRDKERRYPKKRAHLSWKENILHRHTRGKFRGDETLEKDP